MKAMICERCGATINPKTMRCEYCGTYYKEDTPTVFCVERQGVDVLSTRFAIDDELISLYDEKILVQYVGNEITKRLVEAISKNVEFYVQEDPLRQRHFVEGRIRVVPPKFKF